MPDVTVGEIKRLLQRQCPGLLHELVPHARREGRVLSAPNPTRPADRPGSFKIWPNGAWREYDEDEETGKGDLIGLIAYVGGHPPKSTAGRRYAVDWAKRRLGLHATGHPKQDQARLAKMRREANEAAARADQDEARRAFQLRLRAQDIVRAAQPFAADAANPVTDYLLARGIDLAAIVDLTPRILRFHDRLRHWTADGKPLFPALVVPAVAVLARDGVPAGISGCHCTFLAPDGRPAKADVVPAKLMLGTIKGSIVPLTLGPGRLTIGEALAVGAAAPVVLCEGIETGLSIAMASEGAARVWACLSLGHLAHAPIGLDCVSSVIVALENDGKAEAIRQRGAVLDSLEASGKPVSTMRPPLGVDCNDTLRGG